MIITNIKRMIAGLMMSSTMLMGLAAVPVAAQGISVNANANVNADVSASGTLNVASRLSALITKANSDVAARLTSLNDLNAKVQAMKNVSATEKSNISSEVQTNVTGLTALQSKIDADTDVTTARTDAETIFTSFRIYALVIPQGYIEVAADRVNTISGLMTALSAKLQARIAADQAAGDNVASLQTALADIGTQTAAANAQASTALSAVVNLTPDQGNATVAASNKAALAGARADIKTATKDLQAARKDIQTIISGLKSFHISASSSASVSH